MAGPAPWSAFPAATTVQNADLLASVQGGVNKNLTRPVFLTAVGAEPIELVGSNGQTVLLNAAGSIIVTATGFGSIAFVGHSGATFQNDGAGFTFTATLAGFFRVDLHLGSGMHIDPAIIHIIVVAPTILQIDYAPAHPGDWSGGVAELLAAVNRIARVVSNNGATPIP